MHGENNMKSDIKIGDNLELHCYKHNGKIHTISDCITVIDIKDDFIVCGDNRTTITENDGSKHKTKEPAIIFFYKHNWFNVLAQLKKQGLYYYCNIASPYLIDDIYLKYIDYDLDLRVYPDGGYKILDKNEYKYHKKIMHYPEDVDKVVNLELKKLIEMCKNHEGPFNNDVIYEYYEKYKDLTNK
jgi:hypothetical protein